MQKKQMIKIIVILSLTLSSLLFLMSWFDYVLGQEVTREEIKILQWHLSESQAEITDGIHFNSVDNIDIGVRVRRPETRYWLDQKTFTPTYIGTKKGKRFYLKNIGNQDLICNKPILTGPFTSSFIVDKRAVTPGNILTFTIYFAPIAIGDYYTIMKLICNDYEKPQEFLLTGKGITK